jgi:hypothetical protein
VSVAPQVVRVLGRDPRPPCSDAERRAASRAAAWLRARGDAPVVHTVWWRPQRLAALGLACGLGAAGSLLSVALPVPGLACAGVALAALAGGAVPPPFPRRASQDVAVAPRGGAPVALVVCARYDSPRAGLAARVPALRRTWLPGARGTLALAAAVVTGAAAARVAGADGVWLGALQLIPTAALLAGAGAALDAGLAGWAPGASSADAAASAVAIHDELSQRTPRHLEPAVVLCGGPRRRPAALAPGRGRAVVMEVVPADGPARWRSSHPQLKAAAGGAGPRAPLLPRAARIGRLPVIRIGGGDVEATVALGVAIAEALDAQID